MKDSLIQKVQSDPSCLAYSSEAAVELSAKASAGVMPIGEGYRKVRRSAATVGLAISMGAVSLLLLNQKDAAVAADSVTSESTITSLPSPTTANRDLLQSDEASQPSSSTYVKLAPLAIEERVKEGESLWRLSQEYRLAAKIIAANDKISSQANLLAGQKLKISSLQEPENSAKKREPAKKIASRSFELVAPEQLNSSLDKLRETRKRLQESLAQLRFEEKELSESWLDRPIPLAVAISENEAGKEFRPPELLPPAKNLSEAESVASAANRVYQVKPGDTLSTIASFHGVSVLELIRANQIRNPNAIAVSQQLTIPENEGGRKTPSNAANRPDSSLPVATASLSPVPLGTPKTDSPSQLLKETSLDPHAKKLIADIEKLQRDYSGNSRSVSISAQAETADSERSTLVASETPNRGWRSDRQPGSDRPEIIQRRGTAQPRIPSPQPVSPNSQDRTQIVGSAPADTGQYNQMMRVPVGETVGPELPPLSVPDEYLPDTLPKFTGYIWPAKGVLTSGYGWRWGRMHKGVDIAAPIGTPIMAAASGEVISAGWNSGGYGNLVKLRHADGSVTLYAHNSRILVRLGQLVEQGELIAEMGSTGYSTGPHLHFEVHPNGESAVNPMAYLPKQRS